MKTLTIHSKNAPAVVSGQAIHTLLGLNNAQSSWEVGDDFQLLKSDPRDRTARPVVFGTAKVVNITKITLVPEKQLICVGDADDLMVFKKELNSIFSINCGHESEESFWNLYRRWNNPKRQLLQWTNYSYNKPAETLQNTFKRAK